MLDLNSIGQRGITNGHAGLGLNDRTIGTNLFVG
jgi:hypothetical protein